METPDLPIFPGNVVTRLNILWRRTHSAKGDYSGFALRFQKCSFHSIFFIQSLMFVIQITHKNSSTTFKSACVFDVVDYFFFKKGIFFSSLTRLFVLLVCQLTHTVRKMTT